MGSQSTGGYATELVGPGDLGQVEALFNAVFSWKPVPAGFAAWRYGSAKLRGVCVGVREQATGKLVASHGIQLLPATGGALVGLSVDVMVHPEHQRRGLGTLMEDRVRAEAERAGCTFLMCFPNPKLASLRDKNPDWKPAVVARAFSRKGVKVDFDRAAVSKEPAAGVDALWGELVHATPPLSGLKRDLAYLTWRFSDNPLNRYDWVRVEAGGTLRAAAVTKLFVDPVTGARVGDVVELLGAGRSDVLAALSLACAHLSDLSVTDIALWAPWTLDEADLKAMGFAPNPARARTLQVRYPVRGSGFDFSHWYLTQSDTDLY